MKLAEEENLKEEINRLQDPEYMAKYAREKYLYSKNGEIIIKIEE
jgi:cell division protein FtsB